MNQSKQTYENPTMEIIRFDTEDIITTSGGDEQPDVENWGQWDPRSGGAN